MSINFFIIWLSLLPLVVWKGAYEGPKVFWFLTGALFLIIFWIVRILREKKDFVFSKSDVWYFLWMAVLLIASLSGVHPLESITGGSFRHQGVIFFLTLWLIGETTRILGQREKNLLIKGIGASVLIESLIVILQFVGGNLYLGKPLGTMGEANAVAGFLAIGTFFLAFQNRLSLLVVLIAVFLTFSKTGFFSFAIASFSSLFRDFRKKLMPGFFLTILIISVAVGYSFLGNKIKYLAAPTTTLWNLEQEDRVLIWRMSLNKVAQKPFLGWGAESSEVVFGVAYKEAGMPLLGIIVDRAHNLFLDVLMWSGVGGLTLFIGWLLLSFKNLNSIEKKLAFLAFLIYAMFQPLSVVHWILLMIIVNI